MKSVLVLVGVFLGVFVGDSALAASINGPLKKFPFHPDGLYSRETTSTVMGMTHTQKGDVCFHPSTGDYSAHIPDGQKCDMKVLKDTETEGKWSADCVTSDGTRIKVVANLIHVDKNTVRSDYDVDGPQGVKIKGQHIFKFLKAECPKTDKKAASHPHGQPVSPGAAMNQCEAIKMAQATCANLPDSSRKQCDNAMKKAYPNAGSCK